MTWIFAHARPYYPEVEEFDTEEEANQAMEKFLEEEHYADGQYEVAAYVAEVAKRHDMKTHY